MESNAKNHIANQLGKDLDRLSMLENRRKLGEMGLDEEIEQLRQAMDVKMVVGKAHNI